MHGTELMPDQFLTTIMYKPKNDDGHDTVAYAAS
jgi:hypothetical protein